MTKRRSTQDDRIAAERERMNLKPWQFAPSEVNDGPSPYTGNCAGHASWIEAQAWRAEIREYDPGYFDNEK